MYERSFYATKTNLSHDYIEADKMEHLLQWKYSQIVRLYQGKIKRREPSIPGSLIVGFFGATGIFRMGLISILGGCLCFLTLCSESECEGFEADEEL